MICQACGIEAPTRYVAFYQNIGALVVRFPRWIEGRLCKSCIHSHFWSMTIITFFLGWWGTISFFLTPFFLLNNVGRYLFCLGMPGVPGGADRPVLTEEAVERIAPHTQRLFDRLNNGGELEEVAHEIADLADVTPAQVVLYLRAVLQAHSR